MTEQIQTGAARYNLEAGTAPSPSVFPGRAHARNRRSPVKRVLLIVGPFFFLVAAVALSAGIVEIVARPPTATPAPTLAEERAIAEHAPTLEPTATPNASTPSQLEPREATASLEGIGDDPGQKLAAGLVSGAEVER